MMVHSLHTPTSLMLVVFISTVERWLRLTCRNVCNDEFEQAYIFGIYNKMLIADLALRSDASSLPETTFLGLNTSICKKRPKFPRTARTKERKTA